MKMKGCKKIRTCKYIKISDYELEDIFKLLGSRFVNFRSSGKIMISPYSVIDRHSITEPVVIDGIAKRVINLLDVAYILFNYPFEFCTEEYFEENFDVIDYSGSFDKKLDGLPIVNLKTPMPTVKKE